eukprot:TRINITY_DN1538_c0_g2_i1.p1 TRINITY_DN1538_c0_g2~~TRINITY_DN1538_c0_g2_i1.p1  ORF type:complete len:533 (-),score=136.73 TRINITY_DN1538_c0_g2_i1:169-1767(-)
MHNCSKALEYSSVALSLEPSNAHAHYIRGRIFLELKRCTDAQECFNQAVNFNKDNIVFLNSLGVLRCELKDHSKACTNFSAAIVKNQKLPDLWLNLGMLYEANKQYSRAEEVYDEALKVLPNASKVEQRKNSLKAKTKLPIEFVQLEYRVPNSMIPLKVYADCLGKKKTEYCLQSSTYANAVRNFSLPLVNSIRNDEAPVKEKEVISKEESKLSGKREMAERKQPSTEKPPKAKAKPKAKDPEAKAAERKDPEPPKAKAKSDSQEAHGHSTQPQPSVPKSKSNAEVPANSQYDVQPSPGPKVVGNFDIGAPMPSYTVINPLVHPQVPMQAMANPYEMRPQAPNGQMMAVYMQNSMLAPKYSLMANPPSMSLMPLIQLQRPADISSLYQIPGMPQGGMMLGMAMPYGLPTAAQMTRPETAPYILGVPRSSYLSPEQYQEQIANLQGLGQSNVEMSHPMVASGYYQVIGNYPGGVAGAFPEGLGRLVGVPAEAALQQHPEEHEARGRLREPEPNDRGVPEQTRSNAGAKKGKYE